MRNYAKIIYRSLFQNRIYSIVNIIGLAISLTCFFLVFIWVLEQLSYDRFLENASSIYRVNTEIRARGTSALSVDNIASQLKSNYPEVTNACRVDQIKRNIIIKYNDNLFYETDAISADSNFFEFFSYDFKIGSRKNALANPNSIVINEEIAAKVFGKRNPLGQVIVINPGDRKRELVVSAVIKNIPSNSQMQFRCVTLLGNLPYWGNGWEYINVSSYIQLRENVDLISFEKKISGIIKQFDSNTSYTLILQRLADIHLHSIHLDDAANISDIIDVKYVYIFAAGSIIILILAAANFINLTLARHLKKVKEASIRKITGASKINLMMQFLGESILLVILAASVAVVLTQLAMPIYNQLFRITPKTHFFDYKIIAGFCFVILIIGVLSGSYPALVLSNVDPLKILQNRFYGNLKGGTIRKVLVIFQFALSIGMIACVLIIKNQINFIMEKDLGIGKERIIYFNGHNLPFDPKDELLKISSVKSVSWSSELPLLVLYKLEGARWEGKMNDTKLNYLRVDEDFFETFGVRVKEGRGFSKSISMDKYEYILNETAVKAMNLKSPIGKRLICLSGLREKYPEQL